MKQTSSTFLLQTYFNINAHTYIHRTWIIHSYPVKTQSKEHGDETQYNTLILLLLTLRFLLLCSFFGTCGFQNIVVRVGTILRWHEWNVKCTHQSMRPAHRNRYTIQVNNVTNPHSHSSYLQKCTKVVAVPKNKHSLLGIQQIWENNLSNKSAFRFVCIHLLWLNEWLTMFWKKSYLFFCAKAIVSALFCSQMSWYIHATEEYHRQSQTRSAIAQRSIVNYK